MIGPLFVRSLRSIAPVLLALAAIAVMYAASIVYLYDPAVSESLVAMREAMPELFAAFNMANVASTLLDFLINYLYGFLFTVLLIVLAVYLAWRLVAGPAKDGSLAWLLAAPRSRGAVALTLVVAEVAAVALVVALCWLGEAVCAEALFPGELDHASLARANGGLFVLGLFAAAVCLASACAFQRPGLGVAVGAGFCVFCFLMGLAGSAGEGLAWLADLSPFAWFDAYGLAAGDGGAALGVMGLVAAALGLNGLAVAVFTRRDFSL